MPDPAANWNWEADTITPGLAIDQIIHVSKYGLGNSLTPTLNYSSNKVLAHKLLQEMNETPKGMRQKGIRSIYGPNVIIHKHFYGDSASNWAWRGRYYTSDGKPSQLVNPSFSALIAQIFIAGKWGNIWELEHKYPSNNLGELVKLTPYRRRGLVQKQWFQRGEVLDPTVVSSYLNVLEYNGAPVMREGESNPLFTKKTYTPYTKIYRNSATIKHDFVSTGAGRRNWDFNALSPKKISLPDKNYLKNSVSGNFKRYEDMSLRDTLQVNLFKNCLAYYDGYKFDALGTDPEVINSIISDCCHIGRIWRTHNYWENSTPNHINPEAAGIRDLSLINLNASDDVIHRNDTLYGDGFYNHPIMHIPVIRISSSTIHQLYSGDPDTSVPQMAWTLDNNLVLDELQGSGNYTDTYLTNWAQENIWYPTYQSKYDIVGSDDWTIEMWFKLNKYPQALSNSQSCHLIGNYVGGADVTDNTAGFQLKALKFASYTSIAFYAHSGNPADPQIQILDLLNIDLDTDAFNYVALQRKQDSIMLGWGDCAHGWHGWYNQSNGTNSAYIGASLSNTSYPVTIGYSPQMKQYETDISVHKIRYHNTAIDTSILTSAFMKEAPGTMSTNLKDEINLSLNYFGIKNDGDLRQVMPIMLDTAGELLTLSQNIIVGGVGNTEAPW